MYMALLIFYVQIIRSDRLDRLDAFYLCQLLPTLRAEPILVTLYSKKLLQFSHV